MDNIEISVKLKDFKLIVDAATMKDHYYNQLKAIKAIIDSDKNAMMVKAEITKIVEYIL